MYEVFIIKILSVCLFYQEITLLLNKFNFSKVKNYKKLLTEKDIPPPPQTQGSIYNNFYDLKGRK